MDDQIISVTITKTTTANHGSHYDIHVNDEYIDTVKSAVEAIGLATNRLIDSHLEKEEN